MELCPTCLGGEMRREDGVLRCSECGAGPRERPLLEPIAVRVLEDGAAPQELLFPDRRHWVRAGRWRAADQEFAVLLADVYALEPHERTRTRQAAPGRILSSQPLINHYCVRGDDWIVHRDGHTRAAPWMAYARKGNQRTVLR